AGVAVRARGAGARAAISRPRRCVFVADRWSRDPSWRSAAESARVAVGAHGAAQARTPGFGSPSPDAPELFYAEKIFEVILGELLGPTGVFREHARDEVLLLLLQLQDLLLNGPGGHQAV